MNSTDSTHNTLAMRWRRQRGRLEVWYATISDPDTGIGLWIHNELVSPTVASELPYIHGWVALFRKGMDTVLERFGPVAMDPESVFSSDKPDAIPVVNNLVVASEQLQGKLERLGWDLALDEGNSAKTLFTFPSWAWSKELLPGAQVVPVASTVVSGTIHLDGKPLELSGTARGNIAHIYSHSNSKKWGWLHGELGGGDVLEVVAATPTRPGMSSLPPFTLVQLRLGGVDWPKDPMAAAPLFRTSLGLPTWSVKGTLGRWRMRAEVTIPEKESIAVPYKDPDGSSATCTNCELADAVILLERRTGVFGWESYHQWTLQGTAHAEIGTRP
jgi:hypothetical protein